MPADWPGGVRHGGDVNPTCRARTEREKARTETITAGHAPVTGGDKRGFSLIAVRAGGPARSSGEASVMGAERRGRVIRGLSVVGQPRRNRRGRNWEWEHRNHRASRSIF